MKLSKMLEKAKFEPIKPCPEYDKDSENARSEPRLHLPAGSAICFMCNGIERRIRLVGHTIEGTRTAGCDCCSSKYAQQYQDGLIVGFCQLLADESYRWETHYE